MKYHLILFVLMVLSPKASAQTGDSLNTVNTIFEVQPDSIERKITIHKWGTDTSYYLHLSVKNISKNTLTYVTNSCFYYNHYSLKIGQRESGLNPAGGCMYNELTPHVLKPGESFSRKEWITGNNLGSLVKGGYNVTLSIPLIKDKETTYRVDGRDFVVKKAWLIFDKQTKITETHIYNTRRKKNSNT
jgi:hypothetical protein